MDTDETRRRLAELQQLALSLGPGVGTVAHWAEPYEPELQRLADARNTAWAAWHESVADYSNAEHAALTAAAAVDEAAEHGDPEAVGAARATAALRLDHAENVALICRRRALAMQRTHRAYIAAAGRITKNPPLETLNRHLDAVGAALDPARKAYVKHLAALRTAGADLRHLANEAAAAVETSSPTAAGNLRRLCDDLPDLSRAGHVADTCRPDVVAAVAHGRARYLPTFRTLEWTAAGGVRTAQHVSDFDPATLPAH